MISTRASLVFIMIYLFVVLGHSKILGTNLNVENGDFLIISAESANSETVNVQEFTISKSLWQSFVRC